MRGVPDRLTVNDEFYENHQFIADKGQGAMRLDKFLADRSFQVSRSRVQNAIKAGLVTVNGDEEKANYKIRPNDVVELMMPKPFDEAVKVQPDNIPLNIIYEDDDLLVLNKPAGMVVHPGVGVYRRTLVNALAYYFQDLPVMEGNPENRPGLVHRIDKDTSGLMVVAKTEFAMFSLAKQFHDHTIHRRYHAIIWGEMEEGEDSGTIENCIARHSRFRKKMTVVPDGEGKLAITHWKVLERLYYVSYMELHLETGRTHQIRVHMSNIGHPLFNDERYGGNRVVKGTIFSKYKSFVDNCFEILPRQALHAKEIGFVHPRTKELMKFDSELPMPMVDCLARWRTYVTDRKQKLTLDQE
jgi:23S rRNA pseudouridine1911/1915/1917 synthase